MSLKEPHFGEVFEYSRGGGRIMYICPTTGGGHPRDWMGVTVRQSGEILTTLGEIAQRVPLDDSPYSHWIWIEADDA